MPVQMEERLRRAALHLSEASNYGELVPGIVETLEDVTSLVQSSSVALVSEQLTSQDLVALLAAEDGRICTAAIATITAMVLRLGGKLRAALAHDDGFLELLDELVYRLSTVNDTTCARSIVSLLMTMLESDEDVLDLFCHKFHGIRPVLKRWQSDGFDVLLRKFGDTVMSGDLQMAEAAYRRRAATVIQAVYRGHRQRRHLADATRTISQLQRRVRARRGQDARHRLEHCRQEAAIFCRTLHRQQWRRCHTEQLMQNVTGISAEKVPGYLRRRRSMAASRIQCAWRAYRVRGQVAGWREDRRRHRAAVAIQRWWRHCLLRASPDADQEPPLRLSEQDVDKYQRLIDSWLEPVCAGGGRTTPCRDDLQRQLAQSQSLLEKVARRLPADAADRRRCRGLLAQIQAICSLLECGGSERPPAAYWCPSRRLAAGARLLHRRAADRPAVPWWRRLDDSDDGYD